MGKIKCPYCFEEFENNRVLFRANTGFTQEELDREEFTSGELDEYKRLFVKFSQKNPDEKLDRYWKSRGGTAGYASADSRWNMPHIDPEDADRFRKMLAPDAGGVGEDGLVRDADGFVTRVYDRYSDKTLPVTRLCPHCHNPLPLQNYGKYPTIFISVVGITTCGKTVYLNQLLNRLALAMGNTGYYITENNLGDFEENVEANMPLPGSTDDSVMRRPLAVNMVSREDHSRAFTIVFYDIAGENCVKWGNDYARIDDQDGRNSRAKEGIASFIAKADGLMFLVDPNQVPGFSAHPDVDSVRKVVGVVNNIRVALNMDQNAWADVPVAVVLTKTDEIRNQYPRGNQSAIFRPTADGVSGLNREDYFAISHELEDYLSTNAATILAQLGQFVRKTFCGVSAITCGVEQRFTKYRNWYILDETCDRKFKELRTWINGWNDRSPEERKFYYDCPIRQITSFDPNTHAPMVDPVTLEPELAPIPMDINESITKEVASDIRTEIYADCADFGDRIYLTMWEVWEEINLVGFPRGAPNPRRVEDPLKWILWRLGKIGPYYQQDPQPRRAFLESARRYQDRLDNWESEQRGKLETFYNGEDLQ